MRKLLLVALVLLSFSTLAFSQADRFWSANNGDRNAIPTDKAVGRLTYPKDFKLFNLNLEPLRQELLSVVDRSSKHLSVITLPNANGELEQFEVYEASNFEPDLQARFPEIRAYSGKGITDKFATVKLSISPQGIQTMVFRTDKENEFIEPYSNDHRVYSVYKSHRDKGKFGWICSTEEQQLSSDINSAISGRIEGSSTGKIKTLRLAQSCNGEYSNWFGATSSSQVGLVLAAFNGTLTRCNGVYEKDLAVHLNLIANTTAVIYYNPSTDPYTTLSSWNKQLQTTLTNIIGAANYDIGHMFGASGGGGNAGCIGCVCVDASKGSGITSPADGIPQGDNFDIDYVVHEVGHQLGANHTFSMSLEGTGQNKEIGSGITIMGYAGITSQDVAPHSIDIFHETSIAQIQANLAAKTCPVSTTMTANHAPVIGATNNYIIPISTPFALTGSATDPENDVLTYCWEQNDNSTTSGASSVASPTKATGPNWLSFSPTASGTRTFPKLSTILAGLNVSGPLPGGDAGANTEALSSVSRTLNFRLTVRDNHPYVAGNTIGQTAFADVVVTVTNTAGPFTVTAPNTAVTWNAGSTATVTWNVNGTNAGSVNCANVNILLSTDGGATFPTVLTAATANDGSQLITVPASPGSLCRVKVEAVGNIFFDISNANFTISGAPACGTPTGLSNTTPTETSTTVSWGAVSGAINYDVDYKTNAASQWINAATATTNLSVGLNSLTGATLYNWRVRANCSGSTSSYIQANFTTATPPPPPCGDPTGLSNTTPTETSTTVSWGAVSGADNYDVDYKTNASGTWINAATGTTSLSANLSSLTAGTLYNWRVRANCSSGAGNYVQANFTTATPPPPCGDPTGLLNTNTTEVSTTVTWNPVSGANNYDVDYKTNASGTWINAATATTSLSANLSGLTAGTLYNWRVRANCSSGSGNYVQANFTTSTPSVPCPGSYDVGNNDIIAGATTIPLNTDVYGLINVRGDNDHYKFIVTTGGTITISLTNLPADFQLALLNSGGTTLQSSTNNGTASETINATVSPGTYYAKVYPKSNGAFNANSCYTLTVQTGTATRMNPELVQLLENKLFVYPNPAGFEANLAFKSKTNGNSVITVINQLGSVVLKRTIAVYEGDNIRRLDVSSLPSGMYYIKMQNGSEIQTAKIIITK
ncbi:MAG TPA: zinc-dependent metalloprotease family protein [Chitinophagaceae bacterium]|nr:zinc-dependent metalloprotease family protein [Chitinophagaceae bacterium]